MPTYSYRCEKCKQEFDKFQQITEEPLKECKCGGKLIRLIGKGSGIIFRGEGWSKDGYSKISKEKT